MDDVTITQNTFENMDLNGHKPVDTENVVAPIVGEIRRDHSYVVAQVEDLEPVDPWNPPVSPTPQPFLWGLPSKIVVVKMDDPAGFRGWSKYCSLVMSRYLSPFIKDDSNIMLLDNLIASYLTPPFLKVCEEERSGFAGYGELRHQATKQYIYWLNEVRRPQFGANFIDPADPPLSREPKLV